jgi:hypothetical protein
MSPTEKLMDAAQRKIPRLPYRAQGSYERAFMSSRGLKDHIRRSRWALAIHESGHAIVANALGWRLRFVLVQPRCASRRSAIVIYHRWRGGSRCHKPFGKM